MKLTIDLENVLFATTEVELENFTGLSAANFVDSVIAPMACQLYWATREKLNLGTHAEMVATYLNEALNNKETK